MRRLLAMSLMLVLAVGIAGCKKDGEKKIEPPKLASEPDKLAQQMVDAAKTGDLHTIYFVLPESYQKDVQGLMAKLGKIDAEVYNSAMALLPKAIAAAKKHKDKLAPMMGMATAMVPGMTPDKIFEAIDKLYAILEKGGLTKHETFAKLDVAQFLGNHGKAIFELAKPGFEDKLPMLDKITFEAKDVKEDGATLIVKMDGKKMEEVALIKVEGKWFPKEGADNWKKGIEEANKELDKMIAELEKNKEDIKKGIAQADEAIKKFDEDGDLGAIPGM